MIRLATLEDEPRVRSCAEDAYAQYIGAIGKRPAPMVADFTALISNNRVYVVDTLGNDIAGYIVFFPKDGHMFVENIAVTPSTMGRGLGKQMLQFCEAEGRRLGLSSIELYTNEKMTGNLTLYPHLGYQEVDRREEDGFNRVYFRKPLS